MSSTVTSGIKLPPPLYFLLPFAGGLLVEFLFPVHLIPAPWRLLAGVLVPSFLLPLWALVTLKRAQTTASVFKKPSILVTTGPYKMTRNPMYLSLVALYLALCITFDAATLPLAIVLVDVNVIRREEAVLQQLFGEEYAQYTSKVRRWI